MRFRPSLSLTLVLAVLATLFALLGNWQLRRSAEKAQLEEAYQNPPVVEAGVGVMDLPIYTRVSLDGRYDLNRHLLLDNQVENQRPGVHVLTLFTTERDETVLVNRGWLALPPSREIPDVTTPAGAIRIEGIVAPEPPVGRRLGGADDLSMDRWPQLVTYFNHDDTEAAFGSVLPDFVVWLDADDPSGFGERAWSPVSVNADRHLGYAVQWYALGATALLIWIILGVRRGNRREENA